MKSVRKHYDEFLAPVYSWILGDFENAYQANVEMFARLELAPECGDLAVDLGCGPGCQSLPLAEIGFKVVALDFCQELLDELQERSGDLPISIVCDDLSKFTEYVDEPARQRHADLDDLFTTLLRAPRHGLNMTEMQILLH